MTIFELVDRYFLFHVLRPESCVCYRSTATALHKRLTKAAQDDIRLITTEALLRFRADLLKKGSPVSFNTHRNRLRTLFRFAIQDGCLDVTPLQRIGPAPVAEKRCKTVSVEATRLIISHLEERGPNDPVARFWVAATKTLYHTGIRRRQLVGLRWGDINFEKMLMTLRSDASKTRKEWDIPFSDALLADLQWLRNLRLEASKVIDPEQPVFDLTLVRPSARPLNGPTITSYYSRLGTTLGVRVSPHRFRHSFATTIVNSTGNLRVAQEWLGHADVKTTCIYINPDVGAMRSAMQHILPL